MRICLTMIVKNEAAVIERAIAAVRDCISDWVIVDTGSVDDTRDKALAALDGIPGLYASLPWNGYADARNHALGLAEQRYREGYALIVDADAVWSNLAADVNVLKENDADFGLARVQTETSFSLSPLVLRLGVGIRYQGNIQELPVKPEGESKSILLQNLRVDCSRSDGATNRDPDKYLRQAQTLLEDFQHTRTSRTAFYLGQAYRNHGDDEKAVYWYLIRAHWAFSNAEPPSTEEVYIALLEAGRALWRLGRIEEARAALLNATVAAPKRREAKAELGRLFSWEAHRTPPSGTFFVESDLETEQALSPRHQLRRHLVMARQCETCRACCTLLEVPGFADGTKPAGTPCMKLTLRSVEGDGQCTATADERPAACSSWSCLWRNGSNLLFKDERPDQIGVMFTDVRKPNGELALAAYEVWPGAFSSPRIDALFARLGKNHPIQLVGTSTTLYERSGNP